VSPETQHLIADYFETEALEPVALKGKAQPLVPYRVTGETAIRTRFEAAERRGLTRYAGRQSELAALHACLEQAVAGQGQFVTVSGEAGLGKSRLLYEFRHAVDRERVTVLQGRCQSYGSKAPYLPLLDALRRGLNFQDDDGPQALHKKAVANILAIDPALQRYLPQYLHLLSIPSDEYALPEGLQGEALRRSFEEALTAIIIQNTQRRPMVYILEDWHWADEASDAVLKQLVPLVSNHPLMCVVIYRPEYRGDWPHLAHHKSIPLAPLEVQQTESIARSVLGTRALPDGLARLLHERTGGNPFFVEEVCRSLAEEGAVLVDGEQAELAGPLERLHVPDTVEAVIRTRVDRLDETARETLRLASVIGREFARRLLEEVAAGRSHLAPILEGLTTQDLIRQIRVLPEAEYMFKHVLMQNVVYETLLLRQRKSMHSLVGRAIEALYADRLEEHYEALAHHYACSDDTARAVEYLDKAGDKAAGYFSLPEARKQFREAVQLLSGSDLTDAAKSRRIELTLKLAKVSHYSASEEVIAAIQTAVGDARSFGDEAAEVRLTYWLGRMHYFMGNQTEAIVHFNNCIDMGERLGDEEMVAIPYVTIGRTCWFTGEYAKGIEYLEKGIPMVERIHDWEEVAYSMGFLGLTYCWTGNLDKGHHLIDDALRIAVEKENLNREAVCLLEMAAALALRGEWDRVLQIAREGHRKSIPTGNAWVMETTRFVIGYAQLMMGNNNTGLSTMRNATQDLDKQSRLLMTLWGGWYAECCVTNGLIQEGQVWTDKVFEYIQHGEHVGEVIAIRARALGAGLSDPPDWPESIEIFEAGLNIARQRGEGPNLALTHFRYAEILHKKGDLDAAREQLDQAATLFRDIKMTWWNDQAEKLKERIDGGEPFRGFAPYVDGPAGT
ncbi:MAG: AAA family ATPase, partial [SAR324 cluster bacterium]|nr:AAA family ATPase [SAR324 cluster bacterium]